MKNVKLTFFWNVSTINKKLATEPVTIAEIINELDWAHGLKIKWDDLKLGVDLDSIGEHLINASYYDTRFNQTFNFLV